MTFTRHGIERLSPSSLNLWIAAPGLWSLRYLAGVRDETGAAMTRGVAVEAGMMHILHNRPDPVETALGIFDMNMMGEIADEITAERDLIPGMVKQCAGWKPPSGLSATQLKVEHYFEGVSIPVIGYLDFAFEDGLIVDLKTTKACPSKPKADHTRQVALYSAARNDAKCALLYVTEKKHAFYELEPAALETGLNELHSAALSLERFLSRFDSGEDAIRCLPIDRDNFRFSEAAKQKLEELHL